MSDPSPTDAARLRELASTEGGSRHYYSRSHIASPHNGHDSKWPKDCQHPDCVLVRTPAPALSALVSRLTALEQQIRMITDRLSLSANPYAWDELDGLRECADDLASLLAQLAPEPTSDPPNGGNPGGGFTTTPYRAQLAPETPERTTP